MRSVTCVHLISVERVLLLCLQRYRLGPPLPFQVCNLSWSKNVNELVSTHGYSQNQIIVWRYPTMQVGGAGLGQPLGRGRAQC